MVYNNNVGTQSQQSWRSRFWVSLWKERQTVFKKNFTLEINSFRNDFVTVKGKVTNGLLSHVALQAQSAERAA